MAENDAYLGSPDNPATAAVVGYITFIGWLLAYFGLYKKQRTGFAAFHLRQALLLHILSFILDVLGLLAFWHLIPYWVIWVLSAILFLLWFAGAIMAINGKQIPLPLIGKWAQQIFHSL
jgi:uncharacterized membrane protein